MKELYTEIKECEICDGKGISNEWIDFETGDFDFEWCECNPERLVIDID